MKTMSQAFQVSDPRLGLCISGEISNLEVTNEEGKACHGLTAMLSKQIVPLELEEAMRRVFPKIEEIVR